MVKRLLSVILAILLILSFTACKKEKDNPTTETTPAETTTKAPTEAPTVQPTTEEYKLDSSKNYTLSIGLPGSYVVTNKEIVDSFIAKYPNIEVRMESEEWHPFTMAIEIKLKAGVAPDCWFQENASILGFATKNYVEDLAPYISKYLNEEDFSQTLFVAQDGDKIWGVPHGANPIALAYNKKIFDDANVPYPTDDWTFDKMLEVAQRLTKRKSPDAPSTDLYGFISSPNMTQGWYPWIRSTGGSCLDETRTKANMTDPKTIQGIANWANSYLTLKVSPSRLSVSAQVFGEQRGAMYFMQYSEAPDQNLKYKDLDYDTAMIPKASDGNRYVINISNTWAINAAAAADSKEAAWAWIQHYLSEESQDIVARTGATLPTRLSSADKLDTTIRPFNKAAFTKGVDEGGTIMEENKTWNLWRKAVNVGLEGVFDGTTTAEDACAKLQEEVQKILDGQ